MMKILEKIKNNKRGQVVLASFGDSVTQGCFEAYASERDKCYGERMKQILNMLYPETPVVFVNGGLGGDTAHGSLNRINDVLRHTPDLTIVSFGLNDCGGGFEKIDEYENALDSIFTQLENVGSEIIFLTQNTTNSSVHPLTAPIHLEAAKAIATHKEKGYLKAYFERARKVCKKHNVKVCDLHPIWEKMEEAGVDVFNLLSNKINHPIREYHYYIALKLIETALE